MSHYDLRQVDAFEALAGLGDGSVDLVFTDPPYSSLEVHRAVGTTTRLSQSLGSSSPWFRTITDEQIGQLMAQLYRVLRKDRHCYVMCDHKTLRVVEDAGKAAGFTYWKPLVWDKVHFGMGYHYRGQYEFICFFEKGKRNLSDLGVPDVLSVPTVSRRQGAYPTEKPADLARTLIQCSTAAGELVLDPFCGSGSTGEAALSLGCDFTGFDIADRAMNESRRRCRLWGQEVPF